MSGISNVFTKLGCSIMAYNSVFELYFHLHFNNPLETLAIEPTDDEFDIQRMKLEDQKETDLFYSQGNLVYKFPMYFGPF